MATLILKSFQRKEKKMVETISHVSFSPLENEVALWEIKARPFEVLMEFQRKGLLSEGTGTLRVFSYYCSVPQLS